MDVVPARVHDADLLSEIGGPDLRRERQVGLLGHRQRIHVGAHRHDRARQAALEQRDDAVLRDAGLNLETELAQIVGDERRRLLLAVRELRELVQSMADFGHRRA